MKVLPFTIPVPADRTIIVQPEVLPHFYPHLHRHAEVQITWVQQGEGTLLAGNSMHTFNSNEIYVFGANQPHLFKSNPDYFAPDSVLQVRALSVFFNPSGNLAPLFRLPEMKAIQSFVSLCRNGFKMPAELVSSLGDMLVRIQQAAPPVQLTLTIEMLNAIAGIHNLQSLSTENYPQEMTDPEGIRIATVYSHIMTNYNRNISLNEIAEVAHLTPNAFCRYFKKHTRTTLVAFINKVRVNEACKLLVNGSLNNIADVAYSCGFTSITNFNYVFRSVMGKSPRDYMAGYADTVKS